MTDHHSALIYTMVIASAADSNMSDHELRTIGEIVNFLPVFRDFDRENITRVTHECAVLLEREDGLDRALQQIVAALPEHLRETAYALACEVVASDGNASQEELRFLEMLRYELAVGRLPAAAIERGTRARYMTL